MGIGQDVLPQSKHNMFELCLKARQSCIATLEWDRSLLLLRMKNQTVANKYCKLVEVEAADFFE